MLSNQKFQSVEPFQLAQSQITVGKFPILDVIAKRWGQFAENTVYQQTGLACDVSAFPVAHQRFADYLGDHSEPSLTYLLELNNSAKALFHIEHQLVNVLNSHSKVLRFVGSLLLDFQNSWYGISTLHISVQKTTKRAKIMLPFEHCLRFILVLEFEHSKTLIEFCSPYSALDSTLKLDSCRLLPSLSIHQKQNEHRARLEHLLENCQYPIHAELGYAVLPKKGNASYLKVGDVLPVYSAVGDQATVKVAQQASFSGTVGMTENHYSIRLNANFVEKEQEHRTRLKKFAPAIWPQVSV